MSHRDQHVPDDLLAAFVDGDIGEHLAVHIAEHLDACPACLNRVTGLEPLSHAFAAAVDPEVPADLVAAVLAEADRPERVPVTELAVGAGLLVGAGLVAALAGNPIGLAVESGVVVAALADGARIVSAGLANSVPTLTFVAALALAGVFATARFVDPLDPSTLTDGRLS